MKAKTKWIWLDDYHDQHPSPPSSPAPRSPPDRWGSGPWQPRRDGQVGWCGTGGCGEQCRPDSQWHPWILKYNVLERLNCLQSRILPISTTSVIVSPAVSKFVFFRNCWKKISNSSWLFLFDQPSLSRCWVHCWWVCGWCASSVSDRSGYWASQATQMGDQRTRGLPFYPETKN